MNKKINGFITLYIAFTGFIVNAQSTDFKNVRKEFLSPKSKTVMVVAHRGVHNDLPENSLAAFQKGIEAGIDVVEMDIRHTKDSVLVLMHDKTVDRTTNGNGPVETYTFEEMKKLRLLHNGKVTDEAIPSFEEALQRLKGKILIDLDIKTPLALKVVETVEKYNAINSVLFLIYDVEQAQSLKKRNPAFKTLVRTNDAQHADSVLKVLHAEAIHIDEEQNNKALISKIKNNNSRVFINSLGAVDKQASSGNIVAFDELLKHGANMIQTDYPELLLKYLRKKKLHK